MLGSNLPAELGHMGGLTKTKLVSTALRCLLCLKAIHKPSQSTVMPPARQLGLGFSYWFAVTVRGLRLRKLTELFSAGKRIRLAYFPVSWAISSGRGGPVMITHLECTALRARIKRRQHAHDGDALLPQVGQPRAAKVQYQDADWVTAPSCATYFSALATHHAQSVQRFGKQVVAYLDAATRDVTRSVGSLIGGCAPHPGGTRKFLARAGCDVWA